MEHHLKSFRTSFERFVHQKAGFGHPKTNFWQKNLQIAFFGWHEITFEGFVTAPKYSCDSTINHKMTSYEALTSSDVLISHSDSRLDNFIRLLLNGPLESHWIRGLKLTSKFRAVQLWVNWKKWQQNQNVVRQFQAVQCDTQNIFSQWEQNTNCFFLKKSKWVLFNYHCIIVSLMRSNVHRYQWVPLGPCYFNRVWRNWGGLHDPYTYPIR